MVPEHLARLTEHVGAVYGVERFPAFLHALIRLEGPERMVELGTGTGLTALWMAHAAKMNGRGRVVTLDNGQDWPRLREILREELAGEWRDTPPGRAVAVENVTFDAYYASLVGWLELGDVLDFRRTDVTFAEAASAGREGDAPWREPLDLVFADIRHDPLAMTAILARFLPRMASHSSIFIDSLSTYWPSYLSLEVLVGLLSQGKIPAALEQAWTPAEAERMVAFLPRHRLTLVHLLERDKVRQNCAAWLKIERADHLPAQVTPLRLGFLHE